MGCSNVAEGISPFALPCAGIRLSGDTSCRANVVFFVQRRPASNFPSGQNLASKIPPSRWTDCSRAGTPFRVRAANPSVCSCCNSGRTCLRGISHGESCFCPMAYSIHFRVKAAFPKKKSSSYRDNGRPGTTLRSLDGCAPLMDMGQVWIRRGTSMFAESTQRLVLEVMLVVGPMISAIRSVCWKQRAIPWSWLSTRGLVSTLWRPRADAVPGMARLWVCDRRAVMHRHQTWHARSPKRWRMFLYKYVQNPNAGQDYSENAVATHSMQFACFQQSVAV
jgi:hypothetical protein